MNRDKAVETLAADVTIAARTVGREWADVITVEDAEQEIWLRLLESSEGYMAKVAGLDKALRIAQLTKIGHQAAMKQRDAYELFTGNHRYGTKQVRALLEAGILERAVEETTPLWELPESVVRQIERSDNETLSEMLDLFAGLKDLWRRNEQYAKFIVAEFQEGNPIHGHAQNLTRAVDALTSAMNNCHRRRHAEYSEGPGTRDVITNSRAQIIKSHDYGGDYDRTGTNYDGWGN